MMQSLRACGKENRHDGPAVRQKGAAVPPGPGGSAPSGPGGVNVQRATGNEISVNELLRHLGLHEYTRQPAMPTDLDKVVILLTGTDLSAQDAARAGADELLRKPFSPLELVTLIDRTTGHRTTVIEDVEALSSFTVVTSAVGKIGAWESNRDVDDAALEPGSVLVLGESPGRLRLREGA